jgi:hypothetical protein
LNEAVLGRDTAVATAEEAVNGGVMGIGSTSRLPISEAMPAPDVYNIRENEQHEWEINMKVQTLSQREFLTVALCSCIQRFGSLQKTLVVNTVFLQGKVKNIHKLDERRFPYWPSVAAAVPLAAC